MPGPLADRAAIVGVGETAPRQQADRTPFSLACEAVKRAVADAGLKLSDIDGMTSYQTADTVESAAVATALGMQLNYGVDIRGGGASTETLAAHAAGLIAGGYCKTVVIFRSGNGRLVNRGGGLAPGGTRAATASGQNAWNVLAGLTTPLQQVGMVAMRHMRDYGTTSRDLGIIAVAHRKHATLNPKARFQRAMTLEEHQNSRWVAKPFHLLDCCQVTDVAAALVVTSAERAYDLRHPAVLIKGGTAQTFSTGEGTQLSRPEMHYAAGHFGRKRTFGMSGISHRDIDIVASDDAFTFTTLIQFEAYGFCEIGEGGPFVASGALDIDGATPSNLSGGHLSEGYSGGIQLVIENVRQLRGTVDDYCPGWQQGIHSFDRARGCRQAMKKEDRGRKDWTGTGRHGRPGTPEIAVSFGWGSPATSSSLVLGTR